VLLECFVNNPKVVDVGDTIEGVVANLAAREKGQRFFYSGLSPEQITRYEQALDDHLALFGVEL